jgi:hypothetical protein
VLDIETDSTIMPDEQADKQSTNEFLQMLAPVLQQLMQMIAAEPKTGEFAGEVLKLAVRPYRAGRALDGAIDQLVELAKTKSDAPRGDDAVTSTNKTAVQIESMKQQAEREKNQAMNALKAHELQLTDQREKAKIASQERMKAAELAAKQGDAGQKAQLENQKAAHDRESHQMSMLADQAKMQADARKMQMAEQAAQARQGDMQARQKERQAQQAFKQQTAPLGRPGL